jgi:hypothetical protein
VVRLNRRITRHFNASVKVLKPGFAVDPHEDGRVTQNWNAATVVSEHDQVACQPADKRTLEDAGLLIQPNILLLSMPKVPYLNGDGRLEVTCEEQNLTDKRCVVTRVTHTANHSLVFVKTL